MARAVSVYPKARADIRRNANHIRRTVSAASADRWNDRIVSAVAALADSADRCPEADEAADLGLPLRCKLFSRRPHVYHILFALDRDTVNVLRVRHAAGDVLTGETTCSTVGVRVALG